MATIDESIAMAMDCETTELVKYLPYILQDFYEIGSLAKSILRVVIEQNTKEHIDVLDLGCGKGAVLCTIAENINSQCIGIDAVKEFIDYANENVKKKGLKNCLFKAGDIRNKELLSGQYDFIILGSIGPVYGNHRETMEFLKPYLKNDGMIILDDGYTENEKEHSIVIKKEYLLREISDSGMEIVKEYIGDETCDESEFEEQLNKIMNRCNELMIQYPEKASILSDYIKKQEKEYHSLQDDITCSTMVIRRKRPNFQCT
ncbi:MAG: methyltransferase domain-containing protein [Bacteroidales bacterium]|nr:methyltransferase domain-containing protein [Bacteroidales bacterium]